MDGKVRGAQEGAARQIEVGGVMLHRPPFHCECSPSGSRHRRAPHLAGYRRKDLNIRGLLSMFRQNPLIAPAFSDVFFFFFTVCFRVASAFSRLWDASFLFAAFSLSLDYSRAISEKSASVSVLAATCHAHPNAGGKTATAAARMLTWVKKMKHKRGKSIAPNGSSRTTPGRFCPSRAATEGLLRN